MSVKLITLASDPELCPPNSWLSPSSPQLSRHPLRFKKYFFRSNSFAFLKSRQFSFLKSSFSAIFFQRFFILAVINTVWGEIKPSPKGGENDDETKSIAQRC